MKFSEHIELVDLNGQCLLTVLDAELHDFLDDFFTERDIESQILLPPGKYQLLFAPAVTMARVHRLLSQIGIDEISRIAEINGKASGFPDGR